MLRALPLPLHPPIRPTPIPTHHPPTALLIRTNDVYLPCSASCPHPSLLTVPSHPTHHSGQSWSVGLCDGPTSVIALGRDGDGSKSAN